MGHGYELVTSYVGEALIQGFDFSSVPDLSHGYIQYQTREKAEARGLYEIMPDDVVILRVDAENVTEPDGVGRASVRLESKKAYTHGLFIGDFAHMPKPVCGSWPAFWAYGPDWPNNGEIDIIEGANMAQRNLMSAHTSGNCLLPTEDEISWTAAQLTSNCTVDWNTGNTGCGYGALPGTDPATYGDDFNAAGGGVYAMAWDAEYIKLWHWTRAEVPSDIESKTPEPETWGTPISVFGGERCDVDSHYKDMNLVININLCGDYAGGIWSTDPQCKDKAPRCQDYVALNPEVFEDSYWEINYIDAYELGYHSSSSSSSSSTSSHSSTSSSSSISTSSSNSMSTSSSTTSASTSSSTGSSASGPDTSSSHSSSSSPTTSISNAQSQEDPSTTLITSTATPHTPSSSQTTTTISLAPNPGHPDGKDPVPAPAKGGELLTTTTTVTTITYTTICPTDPSRLEPTTTVATLTLSNCHCGEPARTEVYVPMETTVQKCQGCGPGGKDEVTLVVPGKKAGVVDGKGDGASKPTVSAGGSWTGSGSGSGKVNGTRDGPTAYRDGTATSKPVGVPTKEVVTAGAARGGVAFGAMVFAGVAALVL